MTPALSTKQKIALARSAQTVVMGARRMLGLGAQCIVGRRGLRWSLDLGEGIDFAIFLLGVFEASTVRQYQKLLTDNCVALDVGANIGAHTLHLARAVGAHGRVIAVEPTDYAFGKLSRNIQLNPSLATRIRTVQALLTDGLKAGVAEPVYSSWPLTPSGETHPLHLGKLMSCEGARMTSLDALVDNLGLKRIDLIKIDIDGHECAMLRGAAATLREFRPRLVMELAPYVLAEYGASLAEFVAILQDAKYRLTDIDSGDSLPLDTTVLDQLIPPGSCRNVLAEPT